MVRKKLWAGAAAAVASVLIGVAAYGPITNAQAEEFGATGKDRVVSAYYAGWNAYGRGYHVKDIPVDKLNMIQYAFGAPTFDEATGAVGCDVIDPWAEYQMVHWGGETTVDGVADNPDDPNQHLFGNFNQLRKLKAKHPHLKVQISLGGWTKSTWFAKVAASPESRAAVAKACVDTFIKGNLKDGGWPAGAGGPGAAAGIFDGIDVDWEYPTQVAGGVVDPSPADRENATLLFQEFRKQLDEVGAANNKHYLLTAAFPAAKNSDAYFELKKVSEILDWLYVMTYDFNGPFSDIAAHSSMMATDPRDPHADDPTWNTPGTVEYYLQQGVAPKKIVVGVPFYGNKFIKTKKAHHGLYSAFDNTGLDPNSLDFQAKVQPSYHDLVDVAKVLGADGKGQNGYRNFWNAQAHVPWLYSVDAPQKLCDEFAPDGTCAKEYLVKVPTVITFENPRSIGERTALVRQKGLRGVFAWEISQDSNDHALMRKLAGLLPRK